MGVVSLLTKIPKVAGKAFDYTKRAIKVSPHVMFGEGADVFVKTVENAPVKDALKLGGKALEDLAEAQAKKAGGKGVFGQALNSLKEVPSVIKESVKDGYKTAKDAGKFGIWGGVKGFFSGVGKKMPLLGNALMIGFALPDILGATVNEGIFSGAKETFNAGSRLCGGAIAAAIGKKFGPIGSLVGWVVGEHLTGKVVGKTYSERKTETQEKTNEQVLLLQQYQQQLGQQLAQQQTTINIPSISQQNYPQGQINFNSNYNANPFGYNNSYSNDLMFRQVRFDTLA